MNPKNTWLLVMVAGALFAFIFFYERNLKTAVSSPQGVMPGLNPGEVSAIQVLLPGQFEISAERTNGGWVLTKPLNYPARSVPIENLLQATAKLFPRFRLTAEDLKGRQDVNQQYGFDPPQATLIFQERSGQRQLRLGFFTAPGDELYTQVVGQDGVDIVDADFIKNLVPHRADDWRENTFIPTNSYCDRLTVATIDKLFIVERPRTNGFWQMTKPVVTRADYPKINALLSHLHGLKISKFINDNPRADLDPYGLQPPKLALDFDRGTNHLFTLQFGVSPAGEENLVYARTDVQGSVVTVPREFILPWLGGFQEFRDRQLARLDGLDLQQMEGFADDHFVVQRSPDEAWRVIQPTNLVADTNAMNGFINAFGGLEAVRFNNEVAVKDTVLPDTNSLALYGLVTPARSYILRGTPASAIANKAASGVLAQLDFGAVKDGKIFVRRADQPNETSVYAVRLEDYAKLPHASLQFRERRIWNFSEDNVRSITIRLNGVPQTFTHEGTNHWTIAAGSQGIFNELAVEVGASELGYLEAQDWIQAGNANESSFGFSEKSLQISAVVNLKGQPLTLTLDLGGYSPRGLRYGAAKLPDGQIWIFEVSKVTLDRLTTYFNIREEAGH